MNNVLEEKNPTLQTNDIEDSSQPKLTVINQYSKP